MTGILISYRRADSAGVAGRLCDRLNQHFGEDRIFLDVADIQVGEDFHKEIDEAIAGCDAVIVVIGKRWTNARDANGMLRLHREDDFVRLEVAAALRKGAKMFPVLVSGAKMPDESELPSDLAELSRHQALSLRNEYFHRDVDELLSSLEESLGWKPIQSKPRSPKRLRSIGILVALILAAAAGYSFWPASNQLTQEAATNEGEPTALPRGADSHSETDANASIPEPGSATAIAAEQSSLDAHLPLEIGTMYRFSLEEDQPVYFELPLVLPGATLVLDGSSPGRSNVRSKLFWLDDAGQTTGLIFEFNEIDFGRRVQELSVERAGTRRFKLENTSFAAQYWMTILPASSPGLVPFLGEHVPESMTLGEPVSGVLRAGREHVWYAVDLPQGHYTASFELTHFHGDRTNLRATVALRNADGSPARQILEMNEIAERHRQVEDFSVIDGGRNNIEIVNDRKDLEYSLTITPRT